MQPRTKQMTASESDMVKEIVALKDRIAQQDAQLTELRAQLDLARKGAKDSIEISGQVYSINVGEFMRMFDEMARGFRQGLPVMHFAYEHLAAILNVELVDAKKIMEVYTA